MVGGSRIVRSWLIFIWQIIWRKVKCACRYSRGTLSNVLRRICFIRQKVTQNRIIGIRPSARGDWPTTRSFTDSAPESLELLHPPKYNHGIINAHDFDGFPPAFYSLCAAVLYVHMTLPPEQPSPHHPTMPPPGG